MGDSWDYRESYTLKKRRVENYYPNRSINIFVETSKKNKKFNIKKPLLVPFWLILPVSGLQHAPFRGLLEHILYLLSLHKSLRAFLGRCRPDEKQRWHLLVLLPFFMNQLLKLSLFLLLRDIAVGQCFFLEPSEYQIYQDQAASIGGFHFK